MKDNFSAASDKYARFRPSYPDALFDYLLSLVPSKDYAWDCGTGNGQIAQKLAPYFEHLSATDISAKQLENPQTAGNIEYSVQPAEQTSFPPNHFDLIT